MQNSLRLAIKEYLFTITFMFIALCTRAQLPGDSWINKESYSVYTCRTVHPDSVFRLFVNGEQEFQLLNVDAYKNLVTLEIRRVNLSENKLTFLKGLKLEQLSLMETGLSSIPEAVFQLKSLKYLDLPFNSIDCINKSICKLKNLRTLVIVGNNIETFPDCFFSFKDQLIMLSVGGNPMPEIYITELKEKLPNTIVINQ